MRLRYVGVLCLLSFVLGAALIPANAGSEKKLERRLKKAEKAIGSLETTVGGLEITVQQLSMRLANVEGDQDDLSDSVASLTSRVGASEAWIDSLRTKTSQLSSSAISPGTYTGLIDGNQVQAPYGCTGETAVWSGVPSSFDDLDC